MAYLITRVCDKDDSQYVGVYGPNITKMTPEQIKKHPKKQKFLLKDDDGNKYAYGLFVEEDYYVSDSNKEGIAGMFMYECDEFEPLDCFGEGNWGCTTIAYYNKETKKYEDIN